MRYVSHHLPFSTQQVVLHSTDYSSPSCLCSAPRCKSIEFLLRYMHPRRTTAVHASEEKESIQYIHVALHAPADVAEPPSKSMVLLLQMYAS